MRGSDKRSGSLFSYVDLEARVRRDHPLRAIRHFADGALEALTVGLGELYSSTGRPSIPPEMLLRAMLLQAFYTIRSERQLMERMEFDLLFRWFVGLSIDDPIWDHSVFSKNRDRLLEGDAAAKFLNAVLAQQGVKRLLSSEHFSVDGTLIEAWASMKSFRPKGEGDTDDPASGGGRNLEVDFKGEKRSNETHESTTDPEARLYRKGAGMEAKLCFIGHALMENRSGRMVMPSGLRPSRSSKRGPIGRAPSPSARTRDRMLRTSSTSSGRCTCARTSRRTPTGDARRSTGARCVTPATVEASASRRRSAGSRPWLDSAGPSSAAAIGSGGPSPLRQRRTTWCGCPSS